MTKQEELNQINKAIDTILKGGQSYTIGSRNLTRADLSKLYEMKKNTEAQINQENSSSFLENTFVANFIGR